MAERVGVTLMTKCAARRRSGRKGSGWSSPDELTALSLS